MAVRKLLVASASILALMGSPGGALAQDEAPADAHEQDAIIVTGIRASLTASINTKREAAAIVDAITAEDIGKFPDKNVAEALQRITGISISREFGEGERVSIRGTAPDLNLTLLNDHAVATADWFVLDQLNAARSFNYLMLPSEIVGALEVYKSPQADLMEGGVGGTVNVKTRMPLDLDPFSASASAQAAYTELADKIDPQFSGLVSWHNADENFGILVSGVYQKRHLRRDGIEVLGYMDAPASLGADLQIPVLVGSALFQQVRERKGANVTLQWKPSDTVEMSLSGLYSHMNADNFNQNYMAWFSNMINNGEVPTGVTVENGTVVSGTFANSAAGYGAVFDAIDRKAHTQTRSIDYNIKYEPADDWVVHGQIGYTDAEGETEAQPFWETIAHTGFTFDLTGSAPRIGFTDIDPNDPNALPELGWASLDNILNTDEEFYVFADVKHDLEWGPFKYLKAGLKYTDHDRETLWIVGRLPSLYPWSGGSCGGVPCSSATVANGLTPGNYLNDIGGAGVLDSYVQVDKAALEQLMLSKTLTPWSPTVTGDFSEMYPLQSFTINEKTFGGYIMGGFEGDGFRGNVGVRIVKTDETAKGWQLGAGGEANAFGSILPITFKNSYTDILPSLNVTFDVTKDVLLRFAAARVMARPDYAKISPQLDLNPNALMGTGGNPNLDPYRASQFDLSLEWYPSREGLVSLALFYKDIQSYITSATFDETHNVESAVNPNPTGCTPVSGQMWSCDFQISRPVNGSGGTNKGLEFSWQQPVWGGFGFLANYTFSDSKKADGKPVEGNSKHTINLSGYFENELLSARLAYNYRSKYYINQDRGSALTSASSYSLDASASVNVLENIALTFDAINLTDKNITYYGENKSQPRAIYDNGRQFYFGVRVKY